MNDAPIVRRLVSVALLAAALTPVAARSAERLDGMPLSVSAARRDLRTTEIRLRQYYRDEFLPELRGLDREIDILRIQLHMHEEEVEHFDALERRVIYSSPFFYTLRRAQMAAITTRAELLRLEDHRTMIWRRRDDRLSLLRMDRNAALERLALAVRIREEARPPRRAPVKPAAPIEHRKKDTPRSVIVARLR